ncbi:AlkA N-terminal domain-containing protein [Pseudomonas neuropathica]|uniref:AlkA N-terminal domain-containing protein n=1 Tax=Pseudomonas neuropathica TaxID=2730425 RepID=UPI003EB7714C
MRLSLAYVPPYDWEAMLGFLAARALEVLEGERPTARELSLRAEAWRPYRGYAAQLLWTSLSRAD